MVVPTRLHRADRVATVDGVNEAPREELSDGWDSCAFCGKEICRGERVMVQPFWRNADAYTYHLACWEQMEDAIAVSAAVHTLLE